MALLENERACVVRVQFLRLPGLKIQFVYPLRTFSLFVMLLGLSKVYAGTPEDLSPKEKAEIAQMDLAPGEKAIYERGVALNKAFALYGLKTFRGYHAEIISIRPAANGAGSEVELRTKLEFTHESGKPWYYGGKSYDIPSRILRLHWPDARPFPFCVGFWVNAYADSKDRVQRISVTPFDYSSIAALRRMPSGLWEICMGTGANGKKVYLLLQPDYVDLDCIFEIEWNVKYGLAFGHFGGVYGGGAIVETEGKGKNWPGWPLANVPGRHVRPGRDGWERYETVLDQGRAAPGGVTRLIPAAQYIAGSDWDVERPLSP